MYRYVKLCAITACLWSTQVAAEDARSLALGGSVIANAKGAHGALSNPAAMMAMKRRAETLHLRLGFSGEVRDTGSAIDTLTDDANQDLLTDLDAEINALSQTNIVCDPFNGNPDDPCITGTQILSDLSGRLLDIIDLVDGESLDAQARADLGVAFTRSRFPVAVHLRSSATGSGRPNVADSDRAYIEEFENLLDDDAITLDEAQNSTFLQVDALGIPLAITDPEDVLASNASGSALIRTQLGVSFATSLAVSGIEVDVGVTPKFSRLTAYNLNVAIRDEFLDDTESAADRFEDSEVSESSFTFDVGGSMELKNDKLPLRLAIVMKNIIQESISTTDGFTFDTEPQLIVGAAINQGIVTVTSDIALNSAKTDNLESQEIALGVEFGTRMFALRGGLAHDAAREQDATSLTLGFALGPLEIGGRTSGIDSMEAGLQLAFSFK